jgi:3-deoxy-manno-octulosonate cytidylyltransferase (CMP-KDO synthetase)
MLGSRTMIEHVHRRAAEARSVDAVLVATDDDRVAAAVDAFGGLAVMTRAEHLSGTDRLAEVAAELASEIVVNVQGDEPLMDPTAIDAVVRLLVDQPTLSMSTLRRRLETPDDFENPAVVKVVVDVDGNALYFSRAPIPFTRPGHETPVVWRHLGLYAYRREFLMRVAALPASPLERAEGLEQLRVLEHGFRIGTAATEADTIGVDTPEDLERVRRLIDASVRV